MFSNTLKIKWPISITENEPEKVEVISHENVGVSSYKPRKFRSILYKQVVALLQVAALNETLSVELEATEIIGCSRL